jgi:hypothetical protein
MSVSGRDLPLATARLDTERARLRLAGKRE